MDAPGVAVRLLGVAEPVEPLSPPPQAAMSAATTTAAAIGFGYGTVC